MPALLWPALALLALVAWNLAFTTGFFHIAVRDGRAFGTVIDILDRAAPLAIVALGMTLVIATRGIDLSVGALLAISGSIAAAMLADGWSMPVATAVAVASGACFGAINGALVAGIGVQPIVATLIVMVAGRGVAQGIAQNVPIRSGSFAFFGNGHLFGLPFTITLALVLLALTAALTRGTALGLFIRAIGNNPLASRYAGVQVRFVTFLVYVFSGLCAATAGIIVASDIRIADAARAGLYWELDAILAAVVGGTLLTGGRFSLLGAALGAVLLQTLTITIFRNDIQVESALVVKAAVVLAVCLLQSEPFRRRLRFRRPA
jgi:simple sugar transport system permease protein